MKTPKQARQAAAELFRLCIVNTAFDEGRARTVVQRLAAARPRGYLGVLSHFRKLVRLDQEAHTALIQSAQTLPADLQAAVKAGLERIYGSGVAASFAENPALIGGMRIRVGSDVYDGSVQARLAALEQGF